MTRLGVRMRFAVLAALLVLVVGVLVALAGYLTLRSSQLGQAARQARDGARQLAALIEVPGSHAAQDPGRNLVDVGDPSLARDFTSSGVLVQIARPDGRVVQSSRGARGLRLPPALRARCLQSGEATVRQAHPPVSVACRRAGPRAGAVGLVVVGAPLGAALDSLARLRMGLALGLAAGVLIAVLAALALARRALRPAARIAEAAESIRSGDLSRRIDYRGPRDELGALAQELDVCFAELEEAVGRQRRFVADASHELKTPIAAIRAHVELLRGWAAAEPAAREAALASLDQAARRMGRLVADLLYLTELDRAPPVAHLPVALDEVLLAVVAEARPLRPDVSVRVRRLDDAVVLGDALRLQQLLVNLFDNALRVTPEHGEIEVDLTAHGGTATLTVSDAGPGIPAQQLERIFDRFYSLAGSSGTGSGTGLGLAIARELAAAHGGGLTARNEPGGGATLRLTLPMALVSSNLHRALIDPSGHERTVRAIEDHHTGGG
jgi:signal transduction histidine kinase